MPAPQRKAAIARAATVLGGGIWATHFVAMLALQLPVDVVYDPIYTLASALLAILMTGAALLILHFVGRTFRHIAVSGCLMGLGVVAMHYVGMYGMRGCIPVYGVWGYVISSVLSAGICIGALKLAYHRRTLQGLMIGGAVYGLAILAMHFSAMSQTGFLPLDRVEPTVRLVPNDVLAMLVLVAAFLICGAFLLTTVTLGGVTGPAGPAEDARPAADTPAEPSPAPEPVALRLPYERDGKTFFAPIEDIVAIQAEGHYTRLHRLSGPAFCPQPITQLAKDLAQASFLQHPSQLPREPDLCGGVRTAQGSGRLPVLAGDWRGPDSRQPGQCGGNQGRAGPLSLRRSCSDIAVGVRSASTIR